MGNKRLLVIYNTVGFPDLENYNKAMKIISQQEVDLIELGIPPNYAKYDGPVIRRSYQVVNGKYTEEELWKLIYNTRKELGIPVILLTYLEDWVQKLDELLNKIHNYEVDAILFPDLLIDFIDEYEKYIKLLKDKNIKTVLFVTPTVPDHIISMVQGLSDFFLYYGIRPTTGIQIPIDITTLIKRVRNYIKNKLVVGFGLNNEEEIKAAILAGADGVAIGSSIIELLQTQNFEGLISKLKRIRSILNVL